MVGFYSNKKVATKSLSHNVGRIDFPFYKYAIIEEVVEGHFPGCLNRNHTFFQYDERKNSFIECAEPDNLKGHIDFWR